MPSENTTIAIDNLTLAMQSINVSIDAFTTALTDSLTLVANALQIGLLFELLLFFGLLTLAFWRQDMILFIVSGLVTLFFSLTWIDNYSGISIVLMFLAVYQLYRAVVMALEAGGPAKGLAQFKGIYNKVRGVFKD